MKSRLILLVILILLFTQGIARPKNRATIKDEIWGESDGKVVKLFTLTNKNGMTLKVTNYGATLTYLSAPDKNGVFENVVLGFDSLKQCVADRGQHGKTIGRVANRIGGAQFTLNGITYKLTANNGANSIHGGPNGFSKQVFDVDKFYANADSAVVSLRYISADMEEGFPGKLTLYLNYVLTKNNEVKLEYKAVTDKPTVVNFTNHTYFNLTGSGSSISDHRLKILADSITPLGSDRLPTGSLVSVKGTIYDFIQASNVREKLEPAVRGYDINYKLRKTGTNLALAAEVISPANGRLLEAFTTEPGMQLFTINNAICLEMQHFPDSPNKPKFPSVVLNPGETYRQVTVYKFSVTRP